ncbi:MAG TPA: GIY-YIG nuclease family protein [Candidatus Acidoferrales bacterium]|nr:GIY-YIG nuclease family protein [Candidatus Acidoferrales bacterium]
MKTYYVYLLRCFDGTFYVGVTGDIDRRLDQHHQGAFDTCYTFMRRPVRLEYVGEFEWIEEAIAFEKKLKSWSHKKKRAFAQREWSNLRRYSRGPDRVRGS